MNNNDLIQQETFAKIGYGLYVATVNDGVKNGGCILNTFMQVANNPNQVIVSVSKQNYTCEVIEKTKAFNINCLTEKTPFAVFKNFGFQSGRTVNKFNGVDFFTSKNALPVLKQYVNGFFSLSVEQSIDLGSHIAFMCTVTEAKVLSNELSITYDYYHNNVKPKAEPKQKHGFICKICGYIYEGEELPPDFICPLCKHGIADFEKL